MTPLIPVMGNARLHAWPKHEAGGRAQYLPLADAMERRYPTDAHFACYSRPDRPRRLSRAALEHDEVPMVAIVFDVDGEGHAATPEWWSGELHKLDALLREHPHGYIYRTRGGYRIVYVLAAPIRLVDDSDRCAWSNLYLAWCRYLHRRFNIVADPSCKDWQRLYRLPHATRDENGAPEEREVIGDPRRVGAWGCELTSADMDVEPAPKPAKQAPASTATSTYYIGRGRLVEAFENAGMLGAEIEPGKRAAVCPWKSAHTTGSDLDGSTIIYEAHAGHDLGWFHCSHAHCAGRTQAEVIGTFTDAEMGNAPRTTTSHADEEACVSSPFEDAAYLDALDAETTSTAAGTTTPAASDTTAPGATTDAGGVTWRPAVERIAEIVQTGPRLATGFPALDKATRGGLRLGKRVVLGGPPGAGKTTLAAQLLWGWARAGYYCAILAADEDLPAVLVRLGQALGLDRDDLEDAARPGHASAFAELRDTIADLGDRLLAVDADDELAPGQPVTVEAVSAELARRRVAGTGPGSVLLIDSVQTVNTADTPNADGPRLRADAVLAAMRRAAKRDGHLVLATSEVSRGSYAAKDPNARVADLASFKESGGIEFKADVAIFLRPVEGTDLVDGSIPKNRLRGPDAPREFRIELRRARAVFVEVDLPSEADRDAAEAERDEAVRARVIEAIEKATSPLRSQNALRERCQTIKPKIRARHDVWNAAIKELTDEGTVVRHRQRGYILATDPHRSRTDPGSQEQTDPPAPIGAGIAAGIAAAPEPRGSGIAELPPKLGGRN